MSKVTRKQTNRSGSKAVLPALVAVGGTVAAGPAAAIQLGDIQVQSRLGEPLRASIAYALGPNEELANYCVSVSGAPSSSGLPTITNTRVRVENGVITLTGSRPVREPMISTRLVINCPYTPRITREYMMFIDPAGLEQETARAAATVAAAPAARQPGNPATEAARAPAREPVRREPQPAIVQGTRYRVQPGESLSEIVQRIENRDLGLWPAVNAIFDANPNAFINDDPNRLKAGSWLVIPEFVGSEVARFDSALSEAPAAAPVLPAEAAEAEMTAVIEAMPTEPVVAEAVSEAVINEPEVIAPEPVAVTEPAAFEDSPVVDETVETIVIPDTPLESPAVSDNPNRSIARIVPESPSAAANDASSTESNGLFGWIVGGGVAIIAFLLLFGRGIFNRFGSTPVAVDTAPVRRRTYEPQPEPMQVEESDFDLDDDSPTEENLALTAELEFGNDLDGEVDVNFDDGFDATAAIDFELPEQAEEKAESDADTSETDIIPPPKVEESSILKSEVLAGDEDYDMSVIVDVTKMPLPEEATERDLQAIEISSADDEDEDGYTLNNEIDYDILEQDYQDELTATQALNMEIEKAARELSDRLADDEQDEEATTSVQISDMSELDVTAEVSAQNEAVISDLDDTNVNEALDPSDFDDTELLVGEEKTVDMQRDEETVEMQADEATAEMPMDEETAEMPVMDKTAELPVADDDKTLEVMTSDGDHTVEVVTRDDDTVEMEVESGRVDSRTG